MTIDGLVHIHTALSRDNGGYVKKGHEIYAPYKGKYGTGVKVYYHNPNSTRYCLVDYYIDESIPTMRNTVWAKQNTVWVKEFVDKYNMHKVHVIKKTKDGHYYYNQKIKGEFFYTKFTKVTLKWIEESLLMDILER